MAEVRYRVKAKCLTTTGVSFDKEFSEDEGGFMTILKDMQALAEDDRIWDPDHKRWWEAKQIAEFKFEGYQRQKKVEW